MDSYESRLVERYDGRADVPPGLAKLMFDFAVAAVSESPADVEQFAYEYFTRLRHGHFSSTTMTTTTSYDEIHRTSRYGNSSTTTKPTQLMVSTNYDARHSFSSLGASPSSGIDGNSSVVLVIPGSDRGQRRISISSNNTSITNRWTADNAVDDEHVWRVEPKQTPSTTGQQTLDNNRRTVLGSPGYDERTDRQITNTYITNHYDEKERRTEPKQTPPTTGKQTPDNINSNIRTVLGSPGYDERTDRQITNTYITNHYDEKERRVEPQQTPPTTSQQTPDNNRRTVLGSPGYDERTDRQITNTYITNHYDEKVRRAEPQQTPPTPGKQTPDNNSVSDRRTVLDSPGYDKRTEERITNTYITNHYDEEASPAEPQQPVPHVRQASPNQTTGKQTPDNNSSRSPGNDDRTDQRITNTSITNNETVQRAEPQQPRSRPASPHRKTGTPSNNGSNPNGLLTVPGNNQEKRTSITSITNLSTTDHLNNDENDVPVPVKPSARKHSIRRNCVAAEAYDPEADDSDVNIKIVHPKSDSQRRRLNENVRNILLFRALDKTRLGEVVDAMFEREVKPGDKVIREGDDGDNFYVIESGKFDIMVKNKKVGSYTDSGSFGELALLYNQPRAATIIARSPGVLWALDRSTFRRIILKAAYHRQKEYEALLEHVPALQSLSAVERMGVVDALNSRRYNDGDQIIRQGDEADCMYFVQEGAVSIKIKFPGADSEKEVVVISKGGYFGELALVTHKPRAASAYAAGTVICAVLDVAAFERLLGPCLDIMQRNINSYDQQREKVSGLPTK